MTVSRLFVFLCVWCSFDLEAQHIGNTEAYRRLPSDRSFRVIYENDLFTQTDRYYSQGALIELINPFIDRSPVSAILLHPEGAAVRSGITLEINAFTPENIGAPEIQNQDQPFSATLMAKQFSVASDSIKKWQLTSAFGAGVIGPAAFGKEIQVGIHRATNSIIPGGWGNQVASDLLVNYSVAYSKTLIDAGKVFRINGDIYGTAGSPFTAASAGATVMLGLMDPSFSNRTSSCSPPRFHFFYHPVITAVGYDATLQGGLFNKNSPYVFSAASVERVIFTQSAGIILNFRKLSLEYSLSAETPRFKNGFSHRFGSLHIGFYF